MSTMPVMKDTDRGQTLLDLIANGLARHSSRTTAEELGDRSAYIGMSDIAHYKSCPRAAICQKLYGSTQTPGISQLVTFQRGHWFEDGIAAVLEELRLPHVRQLEIVPEGLAAPIRAHLDFVLACTRPYPTVRVLEVKSMRAIPDALYDGYEMQVQGQVGLLTRYWADPVFSAAGVTGTFPQVAKALWGIDLPESPSAVDVEGWVLALSMTEAKAFGPYSGAAQWQGNGNSLADILETGTLMWEEMRAVQAGELSPGRLTTAKGFNPLCEHCAWNAECPKFTGSEHPELAEDLDTLASLKAEKTRLEDQIKSAETGIRSWYSQHPMQGDWIAAGDWRFRTTPVAGRKTLDKAGLAAELDSLGLDGQALLARHEKTGAVSSRLVINQINNKPQK